MNINRIMQEIEGVFLELGFKNEIVGEKRFRYLVYNGCYCKITYLQSRKAFVIECADNEKDASEGVLEDGDWYYLDDSLENLLIKLRQDIVTYYMT